MIIAWGGIPDHGFWVALFLFPCKLNIWRLIFVRWCWEGIHLYNWTWCYEGYGFHRCYWELVLVWIFHRYVINIFWITVLTFLWMFEIVFVWTILSDILIYRGGCPFLSILPWWWPRWFAFMGYASVEVSCLMLFSSFPFELLLLSVLVSMYFQQGLLERLTETMKISISFLHTRTFLLDTMGIRSVLLNVLLNCTLFLEHVGYSPQCYYLTADYSC